MVDKCNFLSFLLFFKWAFSSDMQSLSGVISDVSYNNVS